MIQPGLFLAGKNGLGCWRTETGGKVEGHRHTIVPGRLGHPLREATAMKKLINRPQAVVEEMVEGLIAAFPGLQRLPGQTVLVRADLPSFAERPVAVISGGGSGHEPAHAGYVGRGMLSAAVAGDVFTSPSPDAVL